MIASRCREVAKIGALFTLLMMGCHSKPIGSAKGKVTFNGTPVTAGSVEFSNDEKGLTYLADLTPEGGFQFEVLDGAGLPPGNYAVAIQPPRIKPGLGYIPPNKSATEYSNIPKKYRSNKTSGFTASVKEGTNEPFVFEMK